MSYLNERLSVTGSPQADPPDDESQAKDGGILDVLRDQAEVSQAELELKSRIHEELITLLDLTRVFTVSREQASRDVSQIARRLLVDEPSIQSSRERERITAEIVDEVFGMGPLTPLLRDATIGDILINGPHKVFVERAGVLELTTTRFKDDEHLLRVMDRIVSSVGRRLSEANPMVDARLPDGSRVNAIIGPLAIDGPSVSIRRFAHNAIDLKGLIKLNTLSEEVANVLMGFVQRRANILITGGTGSGKTTLLNVLSGWIGAAERIVTIEDSAELALKQNHVVRLETRLPNAEGLGRVTIRDLVVNSLRMRPDRLVVGEVRGDEVLDMLQAMNTGHDGSMTTLHANSARDAVKRIEALVGMAGSGMEPSAARALIASAFDVIIHVARLSNGQRKVMSVSEVGEGADGAVLVREVIELKPDSGDRFAASLSVGTLPGASDSESTDSPASDDAEAADSRGLSLATMKSGDRSS